MKTQLINAIFSGFNGDWIHIEPKKALTGLTPITAKQKPNNSTHSCWELLHHIVIWQDAIIKHINGETIDWNEIEKNDNWPITELMRDESNFNNLVDRFYSGIEEAQNLLQKVDFTRTSSGFPQLSVIKLYLVLLQHVSYHIGQLITIRKCLGDWPPK